MTNDGRDEQSERNKDGNVADGKYQSENGGGERNATWQYRNGEEN